MMYEDVCRYHVITNFYSERTNIDTVAHLFLRGGLLFIIQPKELAKKNLIINKGIEMLLNFSSQIYKNMAVYIKNYHNKLFLYLKVERNVKLLYNLKKK